ncbi:hypothetical protein MIR68_005826 [Amoeboaphelidium protococcarum]|nr:hypothetical protein MIR68_005826 [Amoeboaphelidium protococcarum]
MVDHALLRIKTRLFKCPAAHLHPLDKIQFKQFAADIIADIEQLISELHTYCESDKLTSLHRKKLVICVRLAAYFDCTVKNEEEELVSVLTTHITRRNKQLIQVDLRALKDIMEAVREIFLQIQSSMKHFELDNNYKESHRLDAGASVLQKLELSPFDKLFDLQQGGILDSTWDDLSKAGVWQATPDYENQQLVVCGIHDEDKFFTMLSNNIPKEYIEYYQEDIPTRRVLDD